MSQNLIERKQLLKDMQELNSRSDFGTLQQEQYDRMDARYVELDALIQTESRAAALASRVESLGKPTMRAQAAATSVGNRVADGDVASTPEYRAAFGRALKSGNFHELRTLTTGTSNAPLPTDMQRRIWQLLQNDMPLRSIARATTIGSDQQVTVETAIPTGYLVNEVDVASSSPAINLVTESDPTFTRKTIGDYAYAARTPITYQAYNDYIQGGTYLADKLAMAVGLAEEQYLMTGTGGAAAANAPAQPSGVVTTVVAAANKYTMTVGTANTSGWGGIVGASEAIIETAHLVSPQYRRGASFRWMIGDTGAKNIRMLKDGNGRYLWQVSDNVAEGITNGLSGNLYGIPVIVSQFMPTAITTGACAALCGDFSNVEIYDRGPIESKLDDMTGLQSLTWKLQAWKRSDVVTYTGVSGLRPFAFLAFK
jgi:HK97 family phage major capsid protein